eukprot:TRINITY_DN1061_c0_g1_i3.p1 TRINITY_DN1061_c0_g1~~TRINITY_DN1061_c0_g1_i3.p1  ORF type:complete len:290 (+),score=78.27 TRINITY_DN1061_c0_g1_i3:136-1005(+)
MWTEAKREWCCKEKQIGCAHPTSLPMVGEFNCKSREMWTEAKREWCCKEKQIGCPAVGHPAELSEFARGMVMRAVAIQFRGNRRKLFKEPMAMLAEVRHTVLAATAGLAPEDVVVTRIGMLRAGARPQAAELAELTVQFSLAMNEEVSAAEFAGAPARGASVLDTAEDMFFDASLRAESPSAMEMLETELVASTPIMFASSLIHPARPEEPEEHDGSSSWAFPLAVAAGVLCVGAVVAGVVMKHKQSKSEAHEDTETLQEHMGASTDGSDVASPPRTCYTSVKPTFGHL